MGKVIPFPGSGSLGTRTPVKKRRGLIVSSPIVIEGNSIHSPRGFHLDPQELRFALLFWDRLRWPQNSGLGHGIGRDAEYLVQRGLLDRPMYPVNGDLAEGVARAHLQGYYDSEAAEPGQWALAQGENSMLIRGLRHDACRSLVVTLHRAIPVPDVPVPLDELLDFKAGAASDLERLRAEMDGIYLQCADSSDPALALTHAVEKVDVACHDAIRALRASGFPIRLSNVKLSLSLSLGSLSSAAMAIFGSEPIQLPAAAAALGTAAASALSFSSDALASRSGPAPGSPYRYVYRFHDELLY